MKHQLIRRIKMAKKTQNATPEISVPETNESQLECLTRQVAEIYGMLEAANNKIAVLEAAAESKAGPKSERAMTEDDARRILALGDLEAAGHKEAAEKLNLSYGQIYSCRKGFTFKQIHKEVEEKLKKAAAEV